MVNEQTTLKVESEAKGEDCCKKIEVDVDKKLTDDSMFVKNESFRDEYYGRKEKGDLKQTLRALRLLHGETKDFAPKMLLEKLPELDGLLKDMKCSFCNRVAQPPVFQCSVGHLICGKDLKHVSNCTFLPKDEEEHEEAYFSHRINLCSKPIINARALYYEELYEILKLGTQQENKVETVPEVKASAPEESSAPVEASAPEESSAPVEASASEKSSASGEGKTLAPNEMDTQSKNTKKYRFTEEDVTFVLVNKNKADVDLFTSIPSVVKHRVPEQVVKRELRRLDIALDKVMMS